MEENLRSLDLSKLEGREEEFTSSEEALNEVEPFLNEEEMKTARGNRREVISIDEAIPEEIKEEFPEFTAEEVVLAGNKKILETGKLPKKFNIMREGIEEPELIIYDKVTKLYNKYKSENNSKRRNGDAIKERIETSIASRHTSQELMKAIENNEIFVMMVF